jgi:hypothetical protein
MNKISIEQVRELRALGLVKQLQLYFFVDEESTDWLDIREVPVEERRFARSWTMPDGTVPTSIRASFYPKHTDDSTVRIELIDGAQLTITVSPDEWSVQASYYTPYEQTELGRSRTLRSIHPQDLTELHAEMVRTNRVFEPVLSWFGREWAKKNK